MRRPLLVTVTVLGVAASSAACHTTRHPATTTPAMTVTPMSSAACAGSGVRVVSDQNGDASMRPGELPHPACRLGYTSAQVLGVLGADRAALFNRWMDERRTERPTCEGSADARARREPECGPHGQVVPAAALKHFVRLLGRERR